jgi:predicted dehydrogenase
LIKKEVGGGSLLDIGIYPIFVALSTLGKPNSIEADALFFENGTDSECNMVFNYPNAKAYLKSTLAADTKTEAIFTFKNAVVKINTMFHEPSTVSIVQNGKEEIIDFDYTTIGYNYEAIHFNELLRAGKKESPVMTFNFSLELIKLLDKVRGVINLEY